MPGKRELLEKLRNIPEDCSNLESNATYWQRAKSKCYQCVPLNQFLLFQAKYLQNASVIDGFLSENFNVYYFKDFSGFFVFFGGIYFCSFEFDLLPVFFYVSICCLRSVDSVLCKICCIMCKVYDINLRSLNFGVFCFSLVKI